MALEMKLNFWHGGRRGVWEVAGCETFNFGATTGRGLQVKKLKVVLRLIDFKFRPLRA